MNNTPELRPGDEGFGGFRMRLPEDCVEYMLFIIREKSDSDLPSLEAVKKAAEKKLTKLARDYIWQREPFKLETKIQKGSGLSHLHGITHYGDNVEDEWLIVYLLRELTKSFPDLWVRVSDSDGEFLLIEAAKVLPKWLSPENDTNRVWIHQGKLLIIPLDNQQPNKNLTLTSAISIIKSTPSTLLHSPFIEAESFYRLEKYPSAISSSTHYSLATIPRKLAYILHSRPQSIAPATEAFYLRDPVSLKPLLFPSASTPLIFPPNDLITISIRFTKVLYAQLKSQHFSPPPPAWKSLLHTAEVEAATNPTFDSAQKKLARLELGTKLTTGFELLCAGDKAETHPNRVVREVALLLEDLAEDGEEGVLPTDEQIEKEWGDAKKEDDDGWMDIDYTQFEKELTGSGSGSKASKAEKTKGERGFGDANTQADLQKIVERFEAFLNDEDAGVDGAVLGNEDEDDDEMDVDDDEDESDDDEEWEDEDKEVSFDEEQFQRMMKEMMGLPGDDGKSSLAQTASTTTNDKGRQKSAAVEELDSEDDEEDEGDEAEEIRKMMQQFESELKGLGALSLDPKATSREIRIKDVGSLSKEEESENDGEEVDIDYNLAKNLLESFKSQAGMAGPAGNLLGLMGVTLPRDEDDDSDEDEDATTHTTTAATIEKGKGKEKT
ncbi:putative small glutamine rich protein with tetratricopeptide repeats 1 [Triangularia setosa]|uniref:Small glutamine rich protein with tetratricopeptide repeats 1 n=1 Tax=Triangularia setosa TaxID=2587417 RepID=A0AAN7AB63_9PEZI|nr:putative small glutamine rich protein with tetratricopeptide repeats 1 [Podospora setosa]